tara:strand:+ start:128 stop:547 length:420 start_codon:yes stop_codon:yes gene_type:complete
MKHLKENYKRFFGKNSLLESEDYEDALHIQNKMAKRLRGKKIDGYVFSVDSQTDNWNWWNEQKQIDLYATPYETLVQYDSGGSGSLPDDIVQVEAHDEDGNDLLMKDFKYKQTDNVSTNLNQYLKIFKQAAKMAEKKIK